MQVASHTTSIFNRPIFNVAKFESILNNGAEYPYKALKFFVISVVS